MKKCLSAIMITLALLTGCNGNIQGNNVDAVKQTAGKQTNELISTDSDNTKNADAQSNEREYTQPEMEGEISISAMSELEFMTIAANQFMKKYPRVKVNINTYRGLSKDAGESPPDEYKTENYRNFLNTKIMTGKAEDIIFTAQLPVKKYIDMGVFEDLSHFLSLSPEINAENYFMNVLESPRDTNGKLYVLPLFCWFEVISFDNRLVSENNSRLDNDMKTISFEKASAFAQQLIDGTSKKNAFLSQNSGAHFFNYIVKDNLKEFVDIEHRQAGIDMERYTALLNQTKELADRGYFAAENSIDFYNMEYYFAFNADSPVQTAFYSLCSSQSYCYPLPLCDAAGNVYTNSNSSLGVNSASKNKELAWEFVKFLLSDEMQSAPSSYGLGVNKKGFEAFAERQLKLYNSTNKENVGKAAYKNLLEKWVMQINAYDTSDPVINDFFWEENVKFFEGKQSAKETARILQAKVDKYLNE